LLCFTHECVEPCFRTWLLTMHKLKTPKNLNKRNFVSPVAKTERKGGLRTRLSLGKVLGPILMRGVRATVAYP
jgi:hypothetical protein